MQKKCGGCEKELPIEQFNIRGINKKNGNIRYQTFCKECNKIHSKKYYEQNKQKHIQRIGIRNKKIHRENKQWLDELKGKKGCKYCPEKNPVCLDWHHLRDKKHLVSAITKNSKELIEKEIAKYEVVCANCHRKLHAELLGAIA